VVHNTGIEQGIGAVAVLNTFYNHSLPLGAYMGSFDNTMPGPYVADLVAHYPATVRNRSQVLAA
jgi:hypothetical protein